MIPSPNTIRIGMISDRFAVRPFGSQILCSLSSEHDPIGSLQYFETSVVSNGDGTEYSLAANVGVTMPARQNAGILVPGLTDPKLLERGFGKEKHFCVKVPFEIASRLANDDLGCHIKITFTKDISDLWSKSDSPQVSRGGVEVIIL